MPTSCGFMVAGHNNNCNNNTILAKATKHIRRLNALTFFTRVHIICGVKTNFFGYLLESA